MNLIVNDIAASEGGALAVISDFYRFAKEDEIGKKIQWTFILSEYLFEETSNIRIHIYKKGFLNWLRRLWFDNFKLNKLCKSCGAEGVLSFQNTVSFTGRIPQLLYMHQVIPFQNEKRFSFLKKEEFLFAIYQYIIGALIKKSVRKANLVVVQAEWLRQLVAKQTNKDLTSIIVKGLDRKVNTIPKNLSKEYDASQFFYPAFECIYKNQSIIREACNILQEKGIEATVDLTIGTKFPESKIINSCGRLSHEEVMLRYKKSTLIFPSYLETVGLPLIEAMSANSIILAADCRYAHETLKNYPNAYYFNPFKPEDLASLMERVINGQIYRQLSSYMYPETIGWHIVIDKFIKLIKSGKDNH